MPPKNFECGLTDGCSPPLGDAAMVRGRETLPLERSKPDKPCVGVQQRVIWRGGAWEFFGEP